MQDPALQVATRDQSKKTKVSGLAAAQSDLQLPYATSLQQRVYVLKKKMPTKVQQRGYVLKEVPPKMNSNLKHCVWGFVNEICLSHFALAPIPAAQLVRELELKQEIWILTCLERRCQTVLVALVRSYCKVV